MPLPREDEMNKISRGKRRQVLLVAIVTLAVLAGLWFGLIGPQNKGLDELAQKIETAQSKLETARKAIAGGKRLEEELGEATLSLDHVEGNMASGDYYSWVINRIRQFKLDYKVEIPQFSGIVGPVDAKLLPRFPYKQVMLTIGGTGYYHDVGRFIADYENDFPYSQLLNLELEPAPALAGSDREKLSFRMEVVTLVKPASP